MATRTRQDLVIKILEILINLPEGQSPETEDSARVDGDLPSILQQLAAEEIVYVPDITQIPEALFLSLAKIIAYEMRSRFGVSGDFEPTLQKGYGEGVLAIKTITRGRPTYETAKALYF